MKQIPSLDQLRAFIAVAEQQNITRAAEQAGITTASMSQKIKQLEQALDNTLFKRTSRGAIPTNAGETLLLAAREVLDSNLNLIALSSALARKVDEGHLDISCPDDFGKRYMTPIVSFFMELHPHVTINLALSNERHKLLESRFDIVLRGYRRFPDQPIEDCNVPMRLVAYREVVLCAAPSYLARQGEPSHPDTLVDHDCIIFNPAQLPATGKEPDTWAFRRRGLRINAQVKGRQTTNSFDVVREYALSGSGIGMLCRDSVRDALDRGELVTVLPDYCPPPVLVHLVTGYGRKSALSQRFSEVLVERLHADYDLQAPAAGQVPWEERIRN